MAEEVRKKLYDLLHTIDGLHCISFSDREGVPLLKVNTDKVPEPTVKPSFVTTFCLAINQGSKLGLGNTKNLVCFYSHYQIIQMNKLPVIITLVANEGSNTGQILALEHQLGAIATAISSSVTE